MIDLLPIYLLVLLYSGPVPGGGVSSTQTSIAQPTEKAAMVFCRRMQAHAYRASEKLKVRCLIYEVRVSDYENRVPEKVFDTEG